jgi:hypothetical protein
MRVGLHDGADSCHLQGRGTFVLFYIRSEPARMSANRSRRRALGHRSVDSSRAAAQYRERRRCEQSRRMFRRAPWHFPIVPEIVCPSNCLIMQAQGVMGDTQPVWIRKSASDEPSAFFSGTAKSLEQADPVTDILKM